MGTEGPDRQQQKINEFLRIMPLTLEIAGLAQAAPGTHLNEGQMEVRGNTIKHAYKIARQLLVDIASK